MVDKEPKYRSVICRLANCSKKRLSWDNTVYYQEPSGRDENGNPVQVTSCTIGPRRVVVSMGEVCDCGSYKPMDAA